MIDFIEGLSVKVNGNNQEINPLFRQDVMFKLYTRPTIPFKLECESPNSRQNLASMISSTVTLHNNHDIEIVTGAFWITFVVLAGSCIVMYLYN